MKKPAFKINRALAVSLLAVFFGLLAGAILIACTGNNPITGLFYLFQGGVFTLERICNSLSVATILICTGLAVTFAFRTGLFNIGAAGQMLMGGLAATAFAHTVQLPGFLIIPLMMVVALMAGGIYGAIAGFLKARFNVHEVVCTIMLNWTAYWIVFYAIPRFFPSADALHSERLPAYADLRFDWLSDLASGSSLNIGFFLALAAVGLVAFLLNKTVLGYELKAVGFNRHGAESSGIRVNRSIVISMAISGALAGLAGFICYTGFSVEMQIGVMPTYGFDGLAISLLGAQTPVGVLLASIFFGILQTGKGFMSAMTSIPPDIADIIIAIIIYFAATSVLLEKLLDKLSLKRAAKASKAQGGRCK